METDSTSGAPRRSPARLNLRRAAAPIAALAAAALLTGCGTASSSGSGTSTTAGSSTTSTNSFNPSLVPAGGSSPGTPPKAAKTKSAKKSGSKSAGAKHSGASTSGSAGSTGSATGGSGTAASGGSGSSAAASTPSAGATRTITVTHTRTVTHTVTRTKYVRPHVPSAAGLPSRLPVLSVSRFDANGGKIGCRISSGTVRCDLARRVWSAPRKPSSCHAAWAQGLMVGSSKSAYFVCARNSVLDPTGTYIKPGYDDKVGSITCQVRSFGVTCFQTNGHGFFIGRTGYLKF